MCVSSLATSSVLPGSLLASEQRCRREGGSGRDDAVGKNSNEENAGWVHEGGKGRRKEGRESVF